MDSVIDRENIIMQNLASSNELIAGIQLAELPQIISSQVVQIKDLGKKIESAIDTANNAKESADKAKGKSVKLGHKAEAITALQGATVDLAQAQSDTVDALKLSFEYEKKLGNISKYLFALGAYSVANTQIVIQQLAEELEKEGKSEKISDVAKQQLMTVINQLKAQEEVMKQQELLNRKINEHAGQIKDLDCQIDDMEEADEKRDEKIAENAEKLLKHAKVLAAQQKKDQEHDEKISENAQDIDELERQEQELNKKIADIASKINEHGRILDKHSKRDVELEQKIQNVSQSTAEAIADLQITITKNVDVINNNIASLENRFKWQIGDMSKKLYESNELFEKKLESVLSEFNNTVSDLKDELETQKTETSNKIKTLEDSINSLHALMSKKAWRIIISIIAGISLLLNILQIFSLI